jgi:4-amino-4-deoxy-L-arabinose transferase-like glycosyltransferase
VLLIATGLRGLDFGVHWDERYYQIRPVKTMVQTGILLPRFYGYPSFVYWVNGVSALTELPRVWRGPDRRQRLLTTMDTRDFLLRLRTIYLLLSSLTVVWVYWLVLRWRNSSLQALLAASFLGLSWEVAYHTRWVATDSMLMQLGALTALLSVLAQRESRRRLLYMAAVVAGLGCGTKYPGVLLLVPVAIAAVCTEDERRGIPRRLLGVTAVFIGVYLLTTPATLLDPGAFLSDLRYEIRHYASGHPGHAIEPGAEHGIRMLTYFGAVVFSAWPVLAVPVFAFSLVGVYAMAREGKTAAVFLSFPLLYAAYFASQRVMIVRNLLVLVPFLAILAAHGAAWLWRRRAWGPLLRPAIAVIVAIVILTNAGWLIYAADTITDRRTDRFVREVASFLSVKNTSPVWISPRLRIHLAAVGWMKRTHIVDDPSRAERLVLYASEAMMQWQEWPGNQPWLTERWFGPYEVNFNMYPTWFGDDRIIVISREQAAAVNLLPLVPDRFVHSLVTDPLSRPTAPQALSPHAIYPCWLVSRDEVERLIGPIVEGPFGATVSDGEACQYASSVGELTFGVFGQDRFELDRPDVGGVITDIGDSAYWYPTGPNSVSLAVRAHDVAFTIHVAVVDGPSPLQIATRLAWTAISRAHQLLKATNQQREPPRQPGQERLLK